jgi:hypothetical protein
VPIRPFLDRDDVFGPEDIAPMSAGFEAALGKLGLEIVVTQQQWASPSLLSSSRR